MPRVQSQNIIDRIGSALLEATFSEEMIFVPHSGNTDFGIDYSVELIDTNKKCTTGCLLNVQLKSHEIINFDKNGNYYQPVNVSTINYWLSINVPVILVIADTTNHKFYGIDAKKAIRENYKDEKTNVQKTTSFVINQKDLFNFETCVRGCVEFEKYNTLLSSAIDSLNIYNFLIYINNTSNRDFHLEVDDYEDLTREIISFSNKYYEPFILDSTLVKLRKEMLDSLGDNYIDGYLSYEGYIEMSRTEFNSCAAKYLFELTNKICDEIDKDKTGKLKTILFKFKRLKKIIQDYGTPAWSVKWASASTNALNSDYDFEEE